MSPERKGSVRRARERAQAGHPPDHGIQMNSFSQPNSRERPFPGPGRRPPPVASPRRSLEQEQSASSWSPMDNETAQQDWNQPPDGARSRGRQQQRPPWPSDAPPFPVPSHPRGYNPSGSLPAQQQDSVSPWQNLPVPMPSTQGGRHDFHNPNATAPYQPHVVPLPPPIVKKVPGLGLPPSSRRAPTSYYSTASNVSPIPEERSDKTARHATSFASSKAIPSSWGSAPPESFILRSADGSSHEDDVDAPLPDDEVTLVRQASLGKRGRPSLRTINRSQTGSTSYDSSKVEDARPKESPVDSAADQSPVHKKSAATQPAMVNPVRHLRSFSTSSSERSFDSEFEKEQFPTTRSGAELTEAQYKEVGVDNASGAPGISQTRPDMKRPPRLDIDAVKEAEARGSLTSLHDLIRRATTVRSNLDKGRTASRLGILDMFNGSGEIKKSRLADGRRASSISNILASFPPPGMATPTGGSRSRANPDVTFPDPDSDHPQKRGRRCCGMPIWAFILVLILLVVLITAAVVIPVMLIVVPRQQAAAAPAVAEPTSTAIGSSSCRSSNPCMNGGVSIGGSDSCGCVCVDGFRGSTCEIKGDSSCVPQNVDINDDSIANATLGSALPRLLEKSEAELNIPLDASKILALFNADGVSCTGQNALVTFAGSNRKRDVDRNALQDKLDKFLNSKVPTNPLRQRQNTHHSDASSHVSTPIRRRGETKPGPISHEVYDFSRAAVLYIYEKTEALSNATDAHDSVERSLKKPNGKPLDLEYGDKKFTLDLNDRSITLPDGAVIGGK